MKNNNYFIFALRPIMFMIPLLFGAPFISLCLCAFNAAMTIIGSGPFYGALTEGVTAALAVMICSSMGLGIHYGVLYALAIAAVSVTAAICVMMRRPFWLGFLLCSLVLGLVTMTGLHQSAARDGMTIAEKLFRGGSDILALLSDTTDSSVYQEYLQLLDSMTELVPAFAALISMAGGYSVMWLVSRVLRPTPLNNGHSFSNIRISAPTVIYCIIMALALAAPVPLIRIAAKNMLTVFIFIFFVAGMSFVEFLLRRKVKKFNIRLLIHSALLICLIVPLINLYVILIYILIGLTDCFASFRERIST
ncbi:MAG: DUF2232 domain-containing protein [Oscillospiraceae bacterium]|nr:DUF2232 domain-containing protein [Oscillospiraceae bacterium]